MKTIPETANEIATMFKNYDGSVIGLLERYEEYRNKVSAAVASETLLQGYGEISSQLPYAVLNSVNDYIFRRIGDIVNMDQKARLEARAKAEKATDTDLRDIQYVVKNICTSYL